MKEPFRYFLSDIFLASKFSERRKLSIKSIFTIVLEEIDNNESEMMTEKMIDNNDHGREDSQLSQHRRHGRYHIFSSELEP